MSDRLIPIYSRSFEESMANGILSIVSFSDVANNKVDPWKFDYQTAIGSICAHRFQMFLITPVHPNTKKQFIIDSSIASRFCEVC